MTKMFGNLTTDGLEKDGDRLGGGGFLIDTGLYNGVVKLAYAGKAQSSNAQSITVLIDLDGKEFRETFWITNKQGENAYTDKRDPSKKRPLTGFTMVDDLALLTTGQSLADQDIEDKVVRLYDYDARAEIPQTVPVLIDLIGKPITLGVLRQIVDKQAKDGSGAYQNTGETKEENVVDKFFHTESQRTVTEIREGMETAVFYPAWEKKNAGQAPRNKAKGAEGRVGAPVRPAGVPPAAGGAKKKSLFG